MNWLLSRLTEPSSHAGLAGVAYGIDQIATGNIGFASIATTLFGLAAFVMPESAPIVGALASAVLPAVSPGTAINDGSST